MSLCPKVAGKQGRGRLVVWTQGGDMGSKWGQSGRLGVRYARQCAGGGLGCRSWLMLSAYLSESWHDLVAGGTLIFGDQHTDKGLGTLMRP